MYYTPAIVIPGYVAHITIELARASARLESTVVLDDSFDIIEDYTF